MRLPRLLAVLLVAALLAAAAGWQLATRSARREAARARAAEARLAALTDSLARVEAWMGTARANEAAGLIDPADLDLLRRQGLADPLRQLRDSLVAHPELIPFKGVGGGTMGFYDTTRVVLLNGRWVYAAFDDGHIGGSGLFEFRVLRGGRVAWKRLAARLDE